MYFLSVFLLALFSTATSKEFISLSFLTCLGQCPDQAVVLQSWGALYGSANANSNLTISVGSYVLYDATSVTINSLTIDGTSDLLFCFYFEKGSLVFSDSKDLALTAHWILVRTGGSLVIGSESCRYQHKVNITLTGSRTTTSEIGDDPVDKIPYGTKGIAIANGGTIELHGALSKPSWTRLAATAQIGDTTITLEDSVSWKVGDRIVIATTDFPEYSNVVPDQNEVRAISAVTGTTVTLDSPLTYMHWGQGTFYTLKFLKLLLGYEHAEVGLLTRNILIRGSEEGSFFGGHIMIRRAVSARIEGDIT
jgi:cell migration-inducing and hyaluronan-binding protein